MAGATTTPVAETKEPNIFVVGLETEVVVYEKKDERTDIGFKAENNAVESMTQSTSGIGVYWSKID